MFNNALMSLSSVLVKDDLILGMPLANEGADAEVVLAARKTGTEASAASTGAKVGGWRSRPRVNYDLVFKAPKVIDGIPRINPDELRLSAAISQVYQALVPNETLAYGLVVDSDVPVGLISARVEGLESVFDEDKRYSDKQLFDVAQQCLFTREIGKLFGIAYCLQEDDFNTGGFVRSKVNSTEEKEHVFKIDHDRSFRALSEEVLNLDPTIRIARGDHPAKFTLTLDMFKRFPFFEGEADQYSPTRWVQHFDARLVGIFTELCKTNVASLQDFVGGMKEGFFAFAGFNPERYRSALTPLFVGREALLNDFLSRLQVRVNDVQRACVAGYVDVLASDYGFVSRERSESVLAEVDDGKAGSFLTSPRLSLGSPMRSVSIPGGSPMRSVSAPEGSPMSMGEGDLYREGASLSLGDSTFNAVRLVFFNAAEEGRQLKFPQPTKPRSPERSNEHKA